MQWGPPRHPLITDQFRRRLTASTEGDNVSSPGSSPDFPQPRRMAFGRGGGLPFINKVEVEALTEGEDDEEDDEDTFRTPGLIAEYRAEEVNLSGNDNEAAAGYVIHSNEGDVTVVRVSEEEADDEGSPRGAVGPAVPTAHPLPPPQEQHQHRGKAKATKRIRYNPIDRNEQTVSEALAQRRAQANAMERDANGRFRARSSTGSNTNDQ